MRAAEFTSFVEREGPRLARAAYLLTGDVLVAEEVTQSALARAFEHWDKVVRADSPGAYVQRILVNEARQHWRRTARRRDAVAPAPVDPSDAWVERHDLVRALELLPTRQREVVVLRFFLDLSEADTATTMGCRPGTVKSQTSKALSALRQHLEQEVHP